MADLSNILEHPGSILLDNSLGPAPDDPDASSYLFRDPVRIIACSVPSEVPHALDALDREVSAGFYAAGYLAYECGYAMGGGRFDEELARDWGSQLGYPILYFGLYREKEALSPETVEMMLGAAGPVRKRNAHVTLEPRTDKATFAEAIRRIRNFIREGDLYQLTYTIRFDGSSGRLDGASGGTIIEALDLYKAMRASQPVRYAAFIQLGDTQILSASPEQFFHRDGNLVSVRPMKGTAPRGATPEVDSMMASWLQGDEKNRSENLMILDLLRNDLSKVCLPKSVRADSLFEVEQFQTLIQMTSPVTGKLAPGTGYADLFAALFPSGSITGAPKIRAMRRIRELEPEPRGIYCGSIGMIDPAGKASFSVAIRTVVHTAESLTTGSGGGIVWDSDEGEEYDECLLKTRFLSRTAREVDRPIQLIESMYCHGGIRHLERHVRRLQNSATALGYELNLESTKAELYAHMGQLNPRDHFKVRLLLSPGGETSISSESITAPGRAGILKIGLTTVRVNSRNPFLRHKTTFRPSWNRARVELATRGLDELIFINEKEQITEGIVTNIFIRLKGRWLTPTTDCGLLGGIGRALELESDNQPAEAILSVDDIRRADEVILTNAVRGRRWAQFVD